VSSGAGDVVPRELAVESDGGVPASLADGETGALADESAGVPPSHTLDSARTTLPAIGGSGSACAREATPVVARTTAAPVAVWAAVRGSRLEKVVSTDGRPDGRRLIQRAIEATRAAAMMSPPAMTSTVGRLQSNSGATAVTVVVLDTSSAIPATAAEKRTPPATVTARSARRESRRDATPDAPP
jgi:hypothetical protein